MLCFEKTARPSTEILNSPFSFGTRRTSTPVFSLIFAARLAALG